jgi:hypothetical protein
VNRLLTEGRRAFLRRVSGIERGTECAKYEPLLSAVADGEASAEDLAILRPHMRTCLSCRAALREFRAMPERVASVVPPAALVASDGGGPLRSLLESVVGLGDRFHAVTELATGQKLAAVAASAAALAGGGTAIDEFANHRGPPRAAQVEPQVADTEEPTATEAPTDPSLPQPPPPTVPPAADGQPVPPAAPQPEPEPPPPDPANEFAPTGGTQPTSAAPPASPPPQERSISLAGSGGGRPSAAGSGEFAP